MEKVIGILKDSVMLFIRYSFIVQIYHWAEGHITSTFPQVSKDTKSTISHVRGTDFVTFVRKLLRMCASSAVLMNSDKVCVL